MCPGQYWWTWSLAPWIPSGLGHSDRSSAQTTLSSVRVVRVSKVSVESYSTINGFDIHQFRTSPVSVPYKVSVSDVNRKPKIWYTNTKSVFGILSQISWYFLGILSVF